MGRLLCHILWDSAREERSVAEVDVQQAVQQIFLREAHAFHDLWDMLPLKVRQLLVALAKEGRSQAQVYSGDFLQKHGLGSASSVQRAVSCLMNEEILEKINGGYHFTGVFFKRWIGDEFA
ncbi:MAG: hypothetical protein U9Q94_04630 [Candidatus Bipolaricaulota bacterium]|nr:hypothetical protein [Candidatus Bipolaricaulota bacterium]